MDKVTTYQKSSFLPALLLLFLTCLSTFAFTQSADRCQNAQSIQCGDALQGTTVGATSDWAPTCSFTHNSPGVWYQFIGANTYVTLSTCGAANFDTRITVFEGDCGTMTCKAWNNDSPICGNNNSQVSFLAAPGQQYFILVNGHQNSAGNFTLSMTCSAPMALNNHCQGAAPLSCGDIALGSTINATVSQPSISPSPISGRGVWYFFEGTGARVTASTCSPTTNFDTRISVFSGVCGSFQFVTENDNHCGNQAQTSFDSQPGKKYFMLVHGANQEMGNFEISLTCPPPPVNDQPCGALPINYGLNVFNNYNAICDLNEVCPGAGSNSSCRAQDGWCSFNTRVECSVWFTFIAPPSGSVNILTDSFDTQIALYTVANCGDYTTFKRLAANDDSGSQLNPYAMGTASGLIEVSCLDPGQVYYLQVDGFNGAEGQGTIELSDVGTAPLTLDAGDCQTRLRGYRPVERDTNFLGATAMGGRPPYRYEWSQDNSILYASSDSSQLAVQPWISTLYTCTVTDARGCRATSQVKVNVVDLSCTSNRGPGIQMCQTNPSNGFSRQICVPVRNVPALLRQPGYSLGPCTPACNATNPSFPPPPSCTNLDLNLTTDGFGMYIGWEIIDLATGLTVASRPTGSLNGFTTYTQAFCLDPNGCYAFKITDFIGDGMCCNFGTGNYSITFDGTTYNSPTGGSFGYEETILIGNCTQGASKQEASTAAPSPQPQLSAYPNPFSSMATIRFQLPQTDQATLSLFNLAGQHIGTLFQGTAEATHLYEAELDGTSLNNGLYLYRLTTEGGINETGKIILSK